VSAAASLHIPKEKRDYLGRWTPEQSDDYLRTARDMVTSIQDKIAKSMRENLGMLDETDVSRDVAATLRSLGASEEIVEAQLLRLNMEGHMSSLEGGDRTPSRGESPPSSPWVNVPNVSETDTTVVVVEEDWYKIAGSADEPEAVTEVGDAEPLDSEQMPTDLFVAVRGHGKRKARRLHSLQSTCPVKPGLGSYRHEWVHDLGTASYSAVCLRCWGKDCMGRPLPNATEDGIPVRGEGLDKDNEAAKDPSEDSDDSCDSSVSEE
jgi:hypothetical protein